MSKTLEKKSYKVKGMTCASCAVSVESMLSNTKGVEKATVNYGTLTSYVEFDPALVQSDDLLKVVDSIGYELVPEEGYDESKEEAEKEKKYKITKYRTIAAFVLSLPVVVFGMYFHMSTIGNWVSMLLSVPVVFYLGKDFFINAIKQARNFKANMDTLVALSTGIAFFFSTFNTLFPEVLLDQGLHPYVYFEAATVIVAFILLGKLLEERAKTKTSSAIKNLMGLQTKVVKALRDGVEVEIAIEQVVRGEQIIIKPGEKIPVDGKVIAGHSFIDESMISGEPIAVEKNLESKVFAGTVNQKGSLTILAEKVGNETVLAQIIKTVKQALGSKAPVQKLVDKVAGIFVPTVIVISILTFLAWYTLGGSSYIAQAVLSAITVLIIACPCALGLATPTAIMVGVGKGAENGILIKDAESLEIAHNVNAIILDKTGTITNGKPAVTDVVWLEGITDKPILEQIIYSAENKSEHPLADAIVKHYKEQNTVLIHLDKFESVTGKGVKVNAQGVNYFIGSPRFIEQSIIPISSSLEQESSRLITEAKTVIYFSDSEKVLAILGIADTIKEGSKEAVQKLQDKGIDVYMLTGDNVQTAKAVAEIVGIKNYQGETLPDDKSDFVKNLQSQGKVVAMVGDGINDSQALAQSDVGIAMAKGTDIAMDVAKITLMQSDLRHILGALALSKATIRTIKQNLFWAFIYNVIGIPLAAGILYPFTGFMLNPMIAGAAMALSSVSVVANSLRLKSIKI